MKRVYGIIPLLFLLAACSTKFSDLTEKFTQQKVEMPTQCAGWEKINLKPQSRYYMLKNDQRSLVDIDAHNLRGQDLGCWK